MGEFDDRNLGRGDGFYILEALHLLESLGELFYYLDGIKIGSGCIINKGERDVQIRSGMEEKDEENCMLGHWKKNWQSQSLTWQMRTHSWNCQRQ